MGVGTSSFVGSRVMRRARCRPLFGVLACGPSRLAAVIMPLLLLCGCSDENSIPAAPVAIDETGIVASVPAQRAEAKQREPEDERLLRVGVIGPETGPQASYGLSVVEGAAAAARRINGGGGVSGREIELVHYDNEGGPGLTQAIIRDLIDQRVVAILSAPTGWSTFAPVHMANESNTIFISIGARRRIGRSGPYVFRAALPDEIATDEVVEYATERFGYVDYAMVTSSTYDYSLDVSASFKQALARHGRALKIEADTYDTYSGKSDVAKVVDTITSDSTSVHGVIFTGGPIEGMQLARALREAGANIPIFGGEDLFSSRYLEGGDSVRGTVVYATFSPDRKSDEMVEFRKQLGEHRPDRFTALAYDCFLLLAQAIELAGTTKSSKVREALVEIDDFEGVTGKMDFAPEGTPIKHAFLHELRKDERGSRFVLLEPAQ